jgi:hypothetical protein
MSDAVALDRTRLGKLLGLLGSDHPGEIAAAGRAADALIRKAGLTWPDVIAPPSALPLPVPNRDEPVFETTPAAIAFCLRHQAELTPWELGFCLSLQRRRKPPTVKQAKVLQSIFVRLPS